MAEELSLVISNPNGGEFLKTICWNKEEFMEFVVSVTDRYNGLTYTEVQVKFAKEDRAKLNSMKKAISDRRIEVKNAVLAPYTQFENEVKDVVSLIEKPISMIDCQIKEYEERAKDEKKQTLESFFKGISTECDFLTFDMVFEQKYLNASVSLKKAREDIKQKVERIVVDYRSIDTFTSKKYKGAAKDIYTRTLNLSDALAEDKRLTEIDRKQEERLRREEEAERLREQEAQATAEAKSETMIEKAISSIEHQAFSTAISGENTLKKSESVPNLKENPTEPEKSIAEPPSGDTSVTDPFASQDDTKQYKASFTIYGTKAQIMAVKQYMIDNNVKFGKVEK